jgi:hypothetical protein
MDNSKNKTSLSLSELHKEVSAFVTAFEKKIPPGVNDQTIRDHLNWIHKNLHLLTVEAVVSEEKAPKPPTRGGKHP